MSDLKTKPTDVSVDAFISQLDNERRRSDARQSLEIYKQVTGHEPVMWGPTIIGFDTYHYRYESGREGTFAAASFSPRKANMTFYVGDEFEDAEELYGKLGKYKKSKACLYINKLADIDLDVLKEIINRDYQLTLSKNSKS